MPALHRCACRIFFIPGYLIMRYIAYTTHRILIKAISPFTLTLYGLHTLAPGVQ